MKFKNASWGGYDEDRFFGPFTYSRDRRGWRPLAISLNSSTDEDDTEQTNLRLSGFGYTLIVVLPPFVRRYKVKVVAHWDDSTVARLGRDWYWDYSPREYGLTCTEGHLSVKYGRQTDDSSTEQRWSCFLPWTQWRHVRRSVYDLDGKHFWTEPEDIRGLDAWKLAREQIDTCPRETFAFEDFDGERLSAATRIEEREWRFGTGSFKWLSAFRKPKIARCLEIEFSGETGERKGSWKGGTIGHSVEMTPGELHEPAFRRYCSEHKMAFVQRAPDAP